MTAGKASGGRRRTVRARLLRVRLVSKTEPVDCVTAKTRVTVAAFAAEELPHSPVGTMIAERLADYYGKRDEHRIARARLRGLAARVRQDIESDAVPGTAEQEPEPRDRASVPRAGPPSRCRWCNSPFDHPAARGDRGDGVCRGCDARRSRDGPVAVGAIADEIGRRLERGAGR